MLRRLVAEFLRPHFGKMLLALIAMGVVAAATAANAWMMQPLMDRVFVERDEALNFGRTFRQNTIIYCRDAKPELIVTDPTCDEIGKVFPGNWRLRS